MNKQEFLKELRGRLAGLPEEDIDERLTFYGESMAYCGRNSYFDRLHTFCGFAVGA